MTQQLYPLQLTDDVLYYAEFTTWDNLKWSWKIYKRNFLYSKEEWEEQTKSMAPFQKSILNREVHPYVMLEGSLNSEDVFPNKDWIKWMVDAFNIKVLKDSNVEKQKTSKLDAHTFGNTPAAENLIKILNDNPLYINRVNRIINKAFVQLKQVSLLEDSIVRGEVLSLIKNKFVKMINDNNIPDIIKSHVCNVITHKYKIYNKL